MFPTHSLLEQNNKELLGKALRKKSDIHLQHNVTDTFERTSQQFLKRLKGICCGREREFTETPSECKLLSQQKNDNATNHQQFCSNNTATQLSNTLNVLIASSEECNNKSFTNKQINKEIQEHNKC